MKGNERIIEKLNDMLADELTAINQYMVHAEMCENWGYGKLHKEIEKRAITEMRHAEKIIERILFLEGMPIVSVLRPMHIGRDVGIMMGNDWNFENDAIKSYNDGIRIAVEVADNGTRDMISEILDNEEEHIDWIEAQQDEIKQVGLPLYLSQQISS